MKEGALTPAVEAVGQIRLEGNVIAHAWYHHLTFANGKPDHIAITLLAEIVYWYRPVYEKDEATGQVTGVRRKFRSDKLQRSYEAFGEQFGWSKTQVKRALDRLKAQGVITTEFRTIKATGGLPLANVLFLEPVPEALHAISTLESAHPYSKVKTGLHGSRDGGPSGVSTYTETPKETSLERVGAAAADAGLAVSSPSQKGKPGKEEPPRLDLETPLRYYRGRPAAPSDLHALKKAVANYRESFGYSVTQRDLNAAAVDARYWWDMNKEGAPKGMLTFWNSLGEVVNELMDAEKPTAPDRADHSDVLTPLSQWLGRLPTALEVRGVLENSKRWEGETRYIVSQFMYDGCLAWLLKAGATIPRTVEAFTRNATQYFNHLIRDKAA